MGDEHGIELAFVGSGNAFAPERCWSGFLANGRYLFDAPPTALYSLKRLHVPLGAIDTILVSHFHADHFFGLPFLLLEYAFETRRSSDLTIAGPPGIEERLTALMELGYPSVISRLEDFRLRFVEVEHGCEATVNDLRLSAVEVEHGGEALRCFGFRAEIGGRVLSYTGDSQFCDQLAQLARGADVVVSDCTYPSGRDNPEHMSLDEVRELQALVGGKTEFVLTHLSRRPETEGLRRITVAEDGARFRF